MCGGVDGGDGCEESIASQVAALSRRQNARCNLQPNEKNGFSYGARKPRGQKMKIMGNGREAYNENTMK